MNDAKCDNERDLGLNINKEHKYGMSVKMNVNAVDQDECEQQNECELGVPSSGEECKPAANNVRMTTCMMEDVNVNECVWSKKGVCKTLNIAGEKYVKPLMNGN